MRLTTRQRLNAARRRPVGPATVLFPSSVGASTVEPAVLAETIEQIEARGQFDCIDVTDELINPTTTATNAVSFVVPARMVARITKIGLTLSNPLVAMSTAISWRVTIDGRQPPHFRHTTDEYFHHSISGVDRPMEIEPLYVKGGSTVAVEVLAAAGFNDALTVTARMGGRLYPSPEGNQ